MYVLRVSDQALLATTDLRKAEREYAKASAPKILYDAQTHQVLEVQGHTASCGR